MLYLITHIAIFLAFASLLGLLLGWLLWGYIARERSKEVESLRERLTDLHIASSRLARESERAPALEESPQVLIEGNLPGAGAQTVPLASLFEENEKPPEPVARVSPVSPSLEAEVKEARLQHMEQLLRELQGVRDRLPLMQADLSNAIASKNSAESKYQELKNDFDIRTRSLVNQIKDLENAAKEWEGQRAELERSALAKEKELAAVRAHLRDLQNNQRPQTAEPVAAAEPNAAIAELAELREQHRKLIAERDSLAGQLESVNQNESGKPADAAHLQQRIAELEESGQNKDATIHEQVLRIETLLWRVAELEPFANAAPQLEEDLKRQQSEIAGHVAVHLEQAEQLESLQKRIAELESATQTAAAHSQKIAELERSLSAKHSETASLEKENRGLLAAHSDMHREMKGWKDYAAQLQPLVSKFPSLESLLAEREAELAKATSALQTKDAELKLLQARMAILSQQLESHRQHLAELEPLAAKVPELEQQFSQRDRENRRQAEALAAQHRDALTRLKVNSALRLRRLRQGMTNFKG